VDVTFARRVGSATCAREVTCIVRAIWEEHSVGSATTRPPSLTTFHVDGVADIIELTVARPH